LQFILSITAFSHKKVLMEKKKTHTVTHEDNIALLNYLAINLVTDSSKSIPRKHFSIFADSQGSQFGKSESYRRKILQKTISNWLSRGYIPALIAKDHDQTLIQSAQSSINLYNSAKSNVDNSSSTTTVTTTSTTTPSKSASTTMNFMSPGAVNLMSNPDHATFHCGTLQTDVEFKLNLQGVVSNITPSCPEISKSGKATGAMDKLLIEIPMWDIRDKFKYRAWLHPEGKGIFIEIPATGGWLFKERATHFNTEKGFPADPDKFTPRCQRTFDSYERMMQGKTNEAHNTMTVYWDFPQDTICSNAHFNKDDHGASQANPQVLQRKNKPMKHWVIPPNPSGSSKAEQDGTYQIVSTIYFEVEIINKHNIAGTGKFKKVDDLSDFADLSIG
jgi:hypothetical protein